MAVIPAQVQQVRYSTPVPQDNPFLTAINAGLQGYFQKKNMNQDLLKSAFPNLVATKQIRPAQPGEQTILPNVPWAWRGAPDLDTIKDQLAIAKSAQDLDEDYQGTKWALEQVASEAKQRNTMAAIAPEATAKLYKNAPPVSQQVQSYKELFANAKKKAKVLQVIRLSDGQRGEIPESEWDATIYKIDTGV